MAAPFSLPGIEKVLVNVKRPDKGQPQLSLVPEGRAARYYTQVPLADGQIISLEGGELLMRAEGITEELQKKAQFLWSSSEADGERLIVITGKGATAIPARNVDEANRAIQDSQLESGVREGLRKRLEAIIRANQEKVAQDKDNAKAFEDAAMANAAGVLTTRALAGDDEAQFHLEAFIKGLQAKGITASEEGAALITYMPATGKDRPHPTLKVDLGTGTELLIQERRTKSGQLRYVCMGLAKLERDQQGRLNFKKPEDKARHREFVKFLILRACESAPNEKGEAQFNGSGKIGDIGSAVYDEKTFQDVFTELKNEGILGQDAKLAIAAKGSKDYKPITDKPSVQAAAKAGESPRGGPGGPAQH